MRLLGSCSNENGVLRAGALGIVVVIAASCVVAVVSECVGAPLEIQPNPNLKLVLQLQTSLNFICGGGKTSSQTNQPKRKISHHHHHHTSVSNTRGHTPRRVAPLHTGPPPQHTTAHRAEPSRAGPIEWRSAHHLTSPPPTPTQPSRGPREGGAVHQARLHTEAPKRIQATVRGRVPGYPPVLLERRTGFFLPPHRSQVLKDGRCTAWRPSWRALLISSRALRRPPRASRR